MEKNREVVLDIVDMTFDGYGVGKAEGLAVFVPLTAVGDKVKVKILKVKKAFCYGKVMEILEPSSDRTEPDCEAFSRCGGCVYRHIDYKAETKIKLNKVSSAMQRIGKAKFPAKEILSAQKTERYRNKAQYPVSTDGSAGFFATHSHRIIPCGDCALQPEIFKSIIGACEEFVKENDISIYNEETNKGLLRHIYIRRATAVGSIMLTLIINGDNLPNAEKLIEKVKSVCGENLKSVQININKKKTNVILGDSCKVLYGDETITDILSGIKVRLSPLSFYQVNRDMAEVLYKKTAEYAEPQDKNILDLYCGAGTIGLSMAKKAKSVIGVEIVPEAIKDAEFNAKANKIENARFICGDAAAAAGQLAKEKITPDVVIVDPPRKGCDAELLKTVTNDFNPERVVYVSCDPATLARDTAVLEEFGYKLQEYTAVDLFPRTSHVETVALFTNSNKDKKKSNL